MHLHNRLSLHQTIYICFCVFLGSSSICSISAIIKYMLYFKWGCSSLCLREDLISRVHVGGVNLWSQLFVCSWLVMWYWWFLLCGTRKRSLCWLMLNGISVIFRKLPVQLRNFLFPPFSPSLILHKITKSLQTLPGDFKSQSFYCHFNHGAGKWNNIPLGSWCYIKHRTKETTQNYTSSTLHSTKFKSHIGHFQHHTFLGFGSRPYPELI